MDEREKKFSIEVVKLDRLTLKEKMYDFFSLGLTELYKDIKFYGRYYLYSYDLHEVYLVGYRGSKQIFSERMPFSFDELRIKLEKNKFVTDKYVFRFLQRTKKFY